MSNLQKEITLVRELAKQCMEVAMSDKHMRMRQRFRDTNDLKVVRPPLIMEEIPWHEMKLEEQFACVCEDPELRSMEYYLRFQLYRERTFKCDIHMNPFWSVHKAFSNTGNGFDWAVREVILTTDKSNNIVSHQYEDILEDEHVLEEMYHDPVVTPYPEQDEKNLARFQEILGDSMPVVLTGHSLWHSPWDSISRLRGVEAALMDLYDCPEYLHRIMTYFTRARSLEMDQMEKYGLYDPHVTNLHCTPGDFTHTTDYDPTFGTCKDTWFRTMAQMFSTVSPETHYEFDMLYSAPLANRCALTYYGCCEPLHDRIDYLKKAYRNLRKIGVSPWADVAASAEIIGGDYVLSRKPNPAHVADRTDPALIRKEISETVELCLRYGCPCDITLKDISTVGYRPENLILWAETASAVLDEYYGEG
jgi:hypothetical protein